MQPTQSDLTDPTLSDAHQLDAADGQTAAEQSLSLADIEASLGKKFPDKATALKAIKDTFSFVGKKQDAAANPAPAQANAELVDKLKSLEQEVFFATNPQYKGHETILAAMQNGRPLSEVANSPEFKTYFEKAQVADQVAQTKSVVASNSRLGAPKTVTDEAKAVANAAGSSTETVAGVFAKAILEGLDNQRS